MSTFDNLASLIQRMSRLLGDYAGGVTTSDLRRLFGRDAQQAYRVLAERREDAAQATSRGRIARFFQGTKLLFLGMSYKLAPARRVLFAIAMACALLGLVRFRTDFASHHVEVDLTPFWFLVSIGTLVFLLALELVDRIVVRDELEVARELQRELLPSEAPSVPGYAFAHSYRTANEVGGDYYEFTPQGDGRLVLAIGDASGHGIAAGLLMAISRASLQLAVDVDPAPENVAAMLNRVLFRTGDRRSFLTLFYGMLEPGTGALSYVCAGHPFPLLRRRDGEILELGRGSLPLGLRDHVELDTENVSLECGDTLLLYSDGLPEAVNAAGEAFGFARLNVLLTPGGEPQAIHDRLDRALRAHLADEPPQDDVSIVVVSRRAG